MSCAPELEAAQIAEAEYAEGDLPIDPVQSLSDESLALDELLFDPMNGVQLRQFRDIACIEHRMLVARAWIVEDRTLPMELIDENYFTDQDTDDDPYCSLRLMDIIIKFAADLVLASEQERIRV